MSQVTRTLHPSHNSSLRIPRLMPQLRAIPEQCHSRRILRFLFQQLRRQPVQCLPRRAAQLLQRSIHYQLVPAFAVLTLHNYKARIA